MGVDRYWEFGDFKRYAKSLELEEVKRYTNNFSRENYLCKFQYGTVYRGKVGEQQVVLKIWDGNNMYHNDAEGSYDMFQEELIVLNTEEFVDHPNLMKAISFCDRGCHAAIVYDFNALDTVHNLIPEDSFSWRHRVKVGLGIASLIKTFHNWRGRGFVIRNINAAHILCDHDYTPKLYDFSEICRGFFLYKKYDGRFGCYGYADPHCIADFEERTWSYHSDVIAFGVVLLGLITKRVADAEPGTDAYDATNWADEAYDQKMEQGQRYPILVHQSLMSDPYFCLRDGRRITQLAMDCINCDPDDYTKMDAIVKTLESLEVVRSYGGAFGVSKMVQDFAFMTVEVGVKRPFEFDSCA